MSNRLPIVGGDSGTPNWGTILNDFLSVAMVPGVSPYSATAAAGSLTYVSITSSNYTIGSGSYTSGNETVIANANGGNITITLPSASTQPSAIHSIKRVDSPSYTLANTVTINTTSSQTIDGSTSAIIYVNYLTITVASDGSNWNII